MWRHMDMPRDACICVRVCACAHMCTSVITKIKHPFHNNAIPLNTCTLYTRPILIIYIMWDYLFVFICTADMASRGAQDRVI